MARARKIAITVDAELLARAEKLRRSTDESRSALFARALRALLAEEERKRKVAEYVEALRRHPEREDEMKWVLEAGKEALRDLPWDDQ